MTAALLAAVLGRACTFERRSAVCGDGLCSGAEDAFACVEDCGCGDGLCDPAEVKSCPGDCCGDGWCDPYEVPTCAADCLPECGNLSCETPAENAFRCIADCVPACLDGVCWLPNEWSCEDCVLRGGESVTLDVGPFDFTTAELDGAFGISEVGLQTALSVAGEAGPYDFSGWGTVWVARKRPGHRARTHDQCHQPGRRS